MILSAAASGVLILSVIAAAVSAVTRRRSAVPSVQVSLYDSVRTQRHEISVKSVGCTLCEFPQELDAAPVEAHPLAEASRSFGCAYLSFISHASTIITSTFGTATLSL